MAEIEKLKNKSIKGGARPGAGRKKGGMNKATLERKIVEEEIRQRVLKSTDKLLDSQMNLAQGCSYLYMVETIMEGKRSTRKKPVLITSPWLIEQYLAGELDDEEKEYYYMTTERPNNQALDSLLDRTFGKALQTTDITSMGEKIETVIHYRPEKISIDELLED
jgi:hypothetical protein